MPCLSQSQTLIGVVALAIFAPQALAGGYQISQRSASAMGRAFAGESALAEDASTLAANPAGMIFLKRPQFSLTASAVQGELQIEVEESALVVPDLARLGLQSRFPTQGQNSVDNVTEGTRFIPAAYAVYPLSESLAFGLGAFSNFASESRFEGDFTGRLFAETSRVTTLNINPSFAWRWNEAIALGFGLNAVRGEAQLGNANPGVGYVRTPDGLGFATNPISKELILAPNGTTLGSAEIRGDAWAFGWNAGLIVQPLSGTLVGLAYRSEIDLELEGEGKFTGTPNVDNFIDFPAEAPLELPAILSASASQDLGSGFRLSADITQTRWSTFETLEIFRSDTGALSSQVQQRWRDSNRYALGLDYTVHPDLTLRTGGAYDQTPIPNETRTLRIATSDLRWYTTGATYRFSDRASLDLAVALVQMSRTGINDTRSFVGQSFEGQLRGSSKLTGQVLSTQLNLSL